MPIGESDVGRRVVVRYVLPSGSATDVVGLLLAFGSDVVTVERRDGTPVDVPRGAVIVSKVVPPRR